MPRAFQFLPVYACRIYSHFNSPTMRSRRGAMRETARRRRAGCGKLSFCGFHPFGRALQAKIPPRRENPHLIITFGERRAIYEQAAVFFKQHGGRIPEGKFVSVRLRDFAVEIRSVIPEVARMRFVGNGGYENRPFRQIQFVNALRAGGCAVVSFSYTARAFSIFLRSLLFRQSYAPPAIPLA